MVWSAADIPSLAGKVAIVTGSTDGLGREVARVLAGKGASVILSGRNVERGAAAVAEIGGDVRFERLDLASVRAFAARFPSVDILVNNAGVALIPERRETADGFEMQIGTNYLGHFALTAALLPALFANGGARVVNVSSIAHGHVKMDLDDLLAERSYSPGKAYGRSKLATLLFAKELDRRARAAGWPLVSVAAHPGVAESNLQAAGPGIGREGKGASLTTRLGIFVTGLIGHSTAAGALPLLRAATDPAAEGGAYFGPDGWAGLRGAPVIVQPKAQALDAASAARLWDISEQLTGARWSAATPA